MKRQSVIWVAIEARRYEDMFRECVEEAAGLYREKQNYTQLEHLGVYASNIEPFSDWEALTMEAMVALKIRRSHRSVCRYGRTIF